MNTIRYLQQTPTQDELDNIYKINDKVKLVYKTLKNKRKYSISDTIGCFQNGRPEDYLLYFWYNWEYFAYNCSLWKKRFDKYSIIVDNDKKQIEFKDDLECEDFYEKYGYEPDEQPYEIQMKSVKLIPRVDLCSWMNNIFYEKYKYNKCKLYVDDLFDY